MANKSSATEWLTKAYHDLSSARILYAAHHYTDTIGIDLQPREQIKDVLDFAEKLFETICRCLAIDRQEVTK